MSKNTNYDKKIFRLLHILNAMQDNQVIKTAELAKEFNVSLRTIQRDIGLLGQTGFALCQGEKGEYSFMPGCSLRQMPISGEEASLLIFLCEVAKSMGTAFEESFHAIFHKVTVSQKKWESPYYAMLPHSELTKMEKALVRQLEEAIEYHRKAKITYLKNDNTTRIYKIWPLKLVIHDGSWYLLTRYDGTTHYPKFRLDKIEQLTVLNEGFTDSRDIQKMLENSTNVWFKEKREIKATLKADKLAAIFLARQPAFPLQKIVKRHKDGSITLETALSHFMEAIPVIMSWLPHVTVLSPQELKQQIDSRVLEYHGREIARQGAVAVSK